MKVNYQYASPSMCLKEENKTTLGLSPDLSREEKVSFVGRLKNPLVFRDAMLMLREIVVSGATLEKKPRTEYFAWLEKEIERRILDHEQYVPDHRTSLQQEARQVIQTRKEKEKEIAKLRDLKNQIQKEIDKCDTWKDYNRLEKDFWKFIKERDLDLWFVLDPVITVHKDQVSFEAFSRDESTYGCLSIPMDEFELQKDPVLGTTNIDFSAKLAREMERFRTYTDVTLAVNPEGFTVDSGVMPEYIEKKIELPETWIKGFAQVSSAACLEGVAIDITPTDFYDICSYLRRHKAKKSPRYMKWILEPEKPIRIWFEPFQEEMILHAIYHGKKKREEKIWGRRRWLVAEKLIPITKHFQIRLMGFGMPQFIIADLGVMKMTIGFSSWSSNDWVKGTAFQVMAGFIGEKNYEPSYKLLKQERSMSWDSLYKSFSNESKEAVRSGIGALLRRGEGYYDPIVEQVRFRQLCSQPIPEELYKETALEKYVQQYQDESLDLYWMSMDANRNLKFHHSYPDLIRNRRNILSQTELIVDQDGQIVKVSCTCREFQSGARNISEPCSHILALYVMSIKFIGLTLEPDKIYKINDIMNLLL